MVTLDEVLNHKEAIICLGSGGVGKTTISSAIALHSARQGDKIIVCTIDPAHRLANALGVKKLGNKETEVLSFRKEGGGTLYAMMLDTKRTFDALIERYAPYENVRRSILENRYYHHLSNYLAGSHEYLAIEKFYELHQASLYQRIILDTPPTQRALDFLDAPNRLGDLLRTTIFRWFFRPYLKMGRWGLQTLHRGLIPLFKIAERLTGIEALQEVTDFVLNFEGMFDGFMERSRKALDLLMGPTAVFFLILTPDRIKVSEALYFYRRIVELRLPFGGFIVNKVHRRLPEGTIPSPSDLSESWNLSPALGKKVFAALSRLENLARVEEENLKLLIHEAPTALFYHVPYLEKDVSSISSLIEIESLLFRHEQNSKP